MSLSVYLKMFCIVNTPYRKDCLEGGRTQGGVFSDIQLLESSCPSIDHRPSHVLCHIIHLHQRYIHASGSKTRIITITGQYGGKLCHKISPSNFSKHIFKLCLSLSLSLIEVDNHPQALDGDQLNLGVAIFMLGSALVPLFAGANFFQSFPSNNLSPEPQSNLKLSLSIKTSSIQPLVSQESVRSGSCLLSLLPLLLVGWSSSSRTTLPCFS